MDPQAPTAVAHKVFGLDQERADTKCMLKCLTCGGADRRMLSPDACCEIGELIIIIIITIMTGHQMQQRCSTHHAVSSRSLTPQSHRRPSSTPQHESCCSTKCSSGARGDCCSALRFSSGS